MDAPGGRNAREFKQLCKLKPIITELVRTQVCFPEPKFLVDKVYAVEMPEDKSHQGAHAFRVYLSDGEKSIQAVLRRGIHDTITSGHIREGSYVVLQRYRQSRGKRLVGEGEVAYIVILDWYSIGEEERHNHDIVFMLNEIPIEKRPEQVERKSSCSTDHEDVETEYTIFKDIVPGDSTVGYTKNKDTQNPGSQPPKTPKNKRKRGYLQDITRSLSSRFADFPPLEKVPSAVKDSCIGMATSFNLQYSSDWYLQAVMKHHYKCHVARPKPNDETVRPSEKLRKVLETPTYLPCESLSQYAIRAIEAGKPLTPFRTVLKLVPLSSIITPNARRNSVVDVLAVICSVSPNTVSRPPLPTKRDLRITDPSCNGKKVLFSVMVEPKHFTPAVGTVALFRSVTSHEWDGGSLNAYPKLCEGKDWFVPNPVEIQGCEVGGYGVSEMREWWDGLVEGEEKRIREDAEKNEVEEVAALELIAEIADGEEGAEEEVEEGPRKRRKV